MRVSQHVRRDDFAAERGAVRMHGALFSASILPARGGRPSFTCVVSKQVSPQATARNLIKRRCRESAHNALKNAPPCVLLFRAKKAAGRATFQEIREDIMMLVEKSTRSRYND